MIPPRQTTLSLRQGDIRCTFSLGKAPRNLLLSSCRHANGSPNFGEVLLHCPRDEKHGHTASATTAPWTIFVQGEWREKCQDLSHCLESNLQINRHFFFQLLTWSFLFGAKLLETSPVLCTMWCTPKSSVIWVVKIE